MTYTFISPNNEYPRYIGDVQLDDPLFNGSIETLPAGWTAVHPVDVPETTFLETVYEDFPTLIDGLYYQNWKVRNKTEQELQTLPPQ